MRSAQVRHVTAGWGTIFNGGGGSGGGANRNTVLDQHISKNGFLIRNILANISNYTVLQALKK